MSKFFGWLKKDKPKEPKEASQEGTGDSNGAFSKLELLNDLRERGILTDEEFNAKKEEILKDI